MAVETSQAYKSVIYTGNAEQRLKFYVNETEITNIEDFCEEISITSKVFPNGSQTFNINQLVSREVTVIVHDLPASTFNGEITFSIGTLIDSTNDTYEDINMGVYNVQEITTGDNNKITISLRDNSVRLDIPYNAKPLIDAHGGSATLKQILDDICITCNISSKIETFNGENKLIGIYDNSINARIYVNYIAGQAGAIPIIDREGELDFVYVNNLTTHKIPLDIVESYELGENFTVGNVEYESGILKYTTTPSLPEEYTQVDYIESNGTQYIDTGINADYKMSIYADIAILGVGAMGAIRQGTNYIRHHFNLSGNQGFRYYFQNSTVIQLFTSETFDNNRHQYLIDMYNKKYKIDDGELTTFTRSTNFDTELNYWIFKRNSNADNLKTSFNMKLYAFKLYYNDELVRDFIPCIRNTDNEVGLYDLVSNTFFTNQGTGNFAYGKKYSTMYVDSANLYINSQEQIDNIYDIVKDFSIDSVSIEKVMGDPAIDPYDLIQVYGYYDANNNFVNDENTIVFTTFANNVLRYSGVSTNTFETIISKEERKSNISLKSNQTFKKEIKAEFDLINGVLSLINNEYLNFLQTSNGTNYVEIENMYANGITKLEISGQMSLLYPSDTLYPSNTLYPLDSYLVIEDEDENKSKYPLYINYLNVGDKYIYTYEFNEEINGYVASAKIIRNDDSEETLTAPIFEMPSGNYKIYMENFSNMNYNVEYVIHNNLTDTLATNTQLSTSITQTRNAIDITAQQLVNKSNIVADINVAVENGQGVVKLTGNSVIINSDKFRLDEDGSIYAYDGKFNGEINGAYFKGGTIELYDDEANVDVGASLIITPHSNYSVGDDYTILSAGGLYLGNDSGSGNKVQIDGGTGQIVCTGNVTALDFVRSCLAEKKCNIEELENALDIIKNTEIYKYNYKSKENKTKKDIGIVIGDNYIYSKELTNDDNTASNLSNMIGVCFKAIKEQQEIIEKLQNEINILKGDE